jgi:predicted phosphodiesterase
MRRGTGRPTIAGLALFLASAVAIAAQGPAADDGVRFAVIGDSGTGGSAQQRVAQQLAKARTRFPFEFVLMLGDNLYGSERPRDYRRKFEEPYKPLLEAGVTFHASLGNHDDPGQAHYEPFNMGGKRYYTFKKGNVRFFALDSNYMDPEQLAWLEKELEASGSDWKICYFHHPIYSSGGRHGSDEDLREQLEPIFVKHGVDVVLAGHEHFYERVKPQKGIHYFTSGAAAKLRKGDVEEGPLTARAFDQGYHFMLIRIAGDELVFEVVSGQGVMVDSGVIRRREDARARQR